MTTELMELYKEVFATWRFQIESYWTRNTYFSAFEIAGLGGAWTISIQHHQTAIFACVMALVLTMIWLLNCLKQLGYIRFWWSKLREFDELRRSEWEKSLAVHGAQTERLVLLASDFERWRLSRPSKLPKIDYEYSMLVLLVQVIFGILWLYLLLFNMVQMGHPIPISK